MKIYFQKLCFVLFIITVGCTASGVSGDPSNTSSGYDKVAKEANKYLKGNPEYFIHPGAYRPPGDNTIKNNNGAAAWTPAAYVYNNVYENLEAYKERLNKATIEGQTQYTQYQQVSGAGFPGLEVGGIQEPTTYYQAGFVCYSLVYNIYNKAGINIFEGLSCDHFLTQNSFSRINQSDVKKGDVVAFDWDGDGINDHLALVTEIISQSPSGIEIVSSLGIVDVHKWGTTTARVSWYNSEANGGVFTVWLNNQPAVVYYYHKNL